MDADAQYVDAPILMWHHVGDPPNDALRPYAVPSHLLATQLDALAREGYEAVTFEELRAGKRPARPVVLTFDDGYTSFLDAASPLLLDRGMRSVLFVVAGSIGGVNDWDDGSTALKLLDAGGVAAASDQGHEIAAHGWRHRRMTTVAARDLELELLAARTVLEGIAGRPVRTLSYPHGEADASTLATAAACGFSIGCLDWRSPEPGWPEGMGLLRVDVGPSTDPTRLIDDAARNTVRIPVGREPAGGAERQPDDPLRRLVARTLDAGDHREPMEAWAAVHGAAGPLAEVLTACEVPAERQPFATLVAGVEAGDARLRRAAPLAAAAAPHARDLDARHDRHPTVPVWGAATPHDAREVPIDDLALGPCWSDPVRYLWEVDAADHAAAAGRYLRAARGRTSRRTARAARRDLPVVEVALLCRDAVETGDWAPVEAAFARVDLDLANPAAVERDTQAEALLLARATGALVRQELRERYRGAWLGIGWAVTQPLVTFAALALFFGRVIHVGVTHYPEFLLAGLVAWMFVQRAVAEAPGAVRGRGDLLRLSAFPRLALPLAVVVTAAVDLVAQLALVVPLLVIRMGPPPARLAMLPALVVLAVALALALALVLAGVTVRYRDVGHLVPLALTVGFYAVPVVYPPSLVPARWALLYHLDPAAVLVELFRTALYGTPWPPGWSVAALNATTAAAVVGAVWWFRHASDRFVAEA